MKRIKFTGFLLVAISLERYFRSSAFELAMSRHVFPSWWNCSHRKGVLTVLRPMLCWKSWIGCSLCVGRSWWF